ncbi:hypothetical protein CC1G_00502 [Coprinopsis cinerea okayama7|uniref:Uncharacterized protein n=1 Tax=Coprinopsis cinerea (strain Okayama-7 / 130 / ATCC MYA-4618 / FGSC 9003) TaxID=240176 RepID=A8N378_COPC7|nr:hypothetical protein CC1G_00502 [Coprinopsis cinerea okayama7\|eukprot:XP_001829323.2 hypothetical protein CC1G_00502 [Coprinopsis cinerea okayama7\
MQSPSTSLEMTTTSQELNFPQGGRSVRKKLRDAATISKADDNLDDHYDLGDVDDGRPKTRRVNPQRLALRLGPELVAEMEALIVPGAKMPTFAVRKDFQERYNVDRRHIYDYFHSRGLRVAKEDKHTNLIRGRAMKAAAAAAAAAAITTPVADAASTPQAIGDAPSAQGPPLQPVQPPTTSSSMVPPALKTATKPRAKVQKTIKKKRTEKIPQKRIFLAPADDGSLHTSSSSISDASPFSSTESLPSISRRQPTNNPIYTHGESPDTSIDPTPDPSAVVSQSDARTSVSLATSLGSSPALFQDEISSIDTEHYLNFLESQQYHCQDSDRALGKQDSSELYACIHNALHSTLLTTEAANSYDAYTRDRALFPNRYSSMSFVAPYGFQSTDLAISPFQDHFPFGDSSDLVDLRMWLSDDLTQGEDHQNHIIPNAATSSFAQARQPLVARYASDGTIVYSRLS